MLGLSLALTPGNPIFAVGGMEIFPAWLEYGSEDASIVYQNPLTAGGAALNTQGLTATIAGDAAGPTHHATDGMRAYTGSADSAYRITGFSAGQQTALTAGGQISFEVQAAAWCSLAADAIGSNGVDQTQATAFLYSFCNNGNSNNGRLSCVRGSSETSYLQCTNASTDTNSLALAFNGWASQSATGTGASGGRFNGYRYPTAKEWIRVNIGWYTDGADRRVVMAVDGLMLTTMLRTDSANPFAGSLILGARGNFFAGPVGNGTVAGTFWNHGYFRNFQLSSLAPVVPDESALGTIGILSDSILAAPSWWNSNYRDLSVTARIHRAVEMTGKRVSTIHRVEAGGHQLDDTGTTSSFADSVAATTKVNNTAATTVADPRGNVKAANPTTVVINGGSNDVADYGTITVTSFTDAIKDHICYFLGLDSTGWVSTGGTDYSGDPPGAPIGHIFLTNICDRGKDWNSYSGCNATNGSPTITVNTNTSLWQNGDGVYGTGVPGGTTVLSGAGTGTLTLSANFTGSTGAVNLYNTTRSITDSPARVAAAALRSCFDGIPPSFAAQFPAETCEIHVIDTFNGMGGTDSYTGKIQPDEVHPDYAGIIRLGDTIGAALAVYA